MIKYNQSIRFLLSIILYSGELFCKVICHIQPFGFQKSMLIKIIIIMDKREISKTDEVKSPALQEEK